MAQSQAEDKVRWLDASEAALLVFAGFYLITALMSWLLGVFPQGVGGWLGASMVPSIVLAAGTVIVRRNFNSVFPIAGPHPRLYAASVAAALLGIVGGMLRGPTYPSALAPLLSETWQLAWALPWVCFLIPIIEEMFFRGTLQAGIGARWGQAVAVAVSIAAFCLAHVGSAEVSTMLAVGILAAVFAQGVHSVLPAIALHMGWNVGTVGMGLIGVIFVPPFFSHPILSVSSACIVAAIAWKIFTRGSDSK